MGRYYSFVRGLLFAVAISPLLSVALEQVTVTFYEQGLTNKTVRRAESFITDGQGFYRVDIDVDEAPVFNLATNYVGGIEQEGQLFSTFSKFNPSLFVRDTNYVGFTCQNVYDNQALVNGGWSRNGTLISPNEVLYCRHYHADNPGRAVSFCNEDGKVFAGYPRWAALHPTKDLALVRLDRDIDESVVPAKVFTENELNLFPYRTPLIGVDRFNVARVHFEYNSALYDWGTDAFRAYADGDSGAPLFIKTGKTIYVVGKMKAPSKWADVTQEDIDLMRELLP